MPSYQITQTQLELLKHDIKKNKILGVGMLSRFIGIHIGNSWRHEFVYIRSMYHPGDDFCRFDFTRNNIYIVKNKKYHRFRIRN